MYEEEFSNRLYQLRTHKGVSARDMSLSLGQNAGYINNIETGKSFPSMSSFFYICEYLNVTPMDFFDFNSAHPNEANILYKNINKLSLSQIESIQEIINGLVKNM